MWRIIFFMKTDKAIEAGLNLTMAKACSIEQVKFVTNPSKFMHDLFNFPKKQHIISRFNQRKLRIKNLCIAHQLEKISSMVSLFKVSIRFNSPSSTLSSKHGHAYNKKVKIYSYLWLTLQPLTYHFRFTGVITQTIKSTGMKHYTSYICKQLSVFGVLRVGFRKKENGFTAKTYCTKFGPYDKNDVNALSEFC